MHNQAKLPTILLLSFGFILILSSITIHNSLKAVPVFKSKPTNNAKCYNTPNGDAIDWDKNTLLNREDFKGSRKWSAGNSVASTYSGFGYDITYDGDDISGEIYVRFYCKKSWWNPKLTNRDKIKNVLAHEQLHFDICELFGRKLYKEILNLTAAKRMNSRSINRIKSKLEKQYSNYQKSYDRGTNHSINITEQKRWNKKIKAELEILSDYSNYQHF